MTVQEKSILLEKFEKLKGYSSIFFFNKDWNEFDIFCNMPMIGKSYSIIENGKQICGVVESYQGYTGKFWVKWSDGEITLENEIDKKIDV